MQVKRFPENLAKRNQWLNLKESKIKPDFDQQNSLCQTVNRDYKVF